MKERFGAYIQDRRESILKYLKSLVEINSYTGSPAGVNAVGDIVARSLGSLGFSEERFARKHIGDHRLLVRPGKGRQILFSCHLDTVFPPDLGFDRCVIGDEVTTGPGVIDMKGGITVLVMALQMLEDLGMRPRSGYTVLLCADEETGSEDARAIIEDVARGKDYGLVFECGGTHAEVVSARKGVGTFRIDIEGKAAHAGNDYASGIDANLEAARKLIEITQLTDLSAGTTVNVGQISGGIGANTISPQAQLVIEFRFTRMEEGERALAGLERIAGESFVPGSRSQLSGRIQRPVMEETAATRDFASLVERVSGGVVKREKRGGVGDANFLAAAGVPTLDGFGPWGGKDHTKEEFMVTRSLLERIDLLARLLCELDA